MHNQFTKTQGPFAEQLGFDTTSGLVPGGSGDIVANLPMVSDKCEGRLCSW